MTEFYEELLEVVWAELRQVINPESNTGNSDTAVVLLEVRRFLLRLGLGQEMWVSNRDGQEGWKAGELQIHPGFESQDLLGVCCMIQT